MEDLLQFITTLAKFAAFPKFDLFFRKYRRILEIMKKILTSSF